MADGLNAECAMKNIIIRCRLYQAMPKMTRQSF